MRQLTILVVAGCSENQLVSMTSMLTEDTALDGQGPVDGDELGPALRVSPEAHDFGSIGLGCDESVEVELASVGAEDLVIDAVVFTGDGFALVDAPSSLELVLEPGSEIRTAVEFTPAVEGLLGAELVVYSNDPFGPRTAAQSGSGVSAGRIVEVFSTPADPPVDLLFAVDQSGSMDDDAASLGANFSMLLDALHDATTDWRIGVVTLDDGCVNGGVLSPGTPSLESAFAEAVSLGTDSEIAYDEALFRLADQALAQTGAADCNHGLARQGAWLHVIVVSDEPEQSSAIAAAYTWEFWVQRLAQRVGSLDNLRISGVVDVDGCNEGAANYLEAIAATGGVALSICTASWGEYVAALADATTSRAAAFALSESPVVDTLEVRVDGVQSEAFVFDAAANEVRFDALPPAASVEVAYDRRGDCP